MSTVPHTIATAPSAAGLRVGAVLLAAGSGSRMGHRPKSLLLLDGEPLILRHWRALHASGVQVVRVVLGHYAGQFEPVLVAAGLRGGQDWITHPDPDRGQVSSQRMGLAALPADLDAVLVALADQPLIGVREIASLIEAYRHRLAGTEVVVPMVQGERGNPVIFSAQVRTHILQGPEDFGCRQWQQANPQAVYRWAAPSAGYVVDLDTPEDIERLRTAGVQDLCWPGDR
jgi:molybdenum cofactor cytidylyltransferase